jgi:phosphoribosyl 1,2-cyclic phosphate phosphodiesterase
VRITFLGTGDAGGVPLYGCSCAACARAHADPSHRRRNCSALIEAGDTRILLDAGLNDLTERFPPGRLSAILLTHFHVDHVQGLFHLRWGKGNAIPVYGPPDAEGCADLYKNHGLLEFRQLAQFEPVSIGSLIITPLPLVHSKVTFGYAIEQPQGSRFAYLTDTAGLPPNTETFLSSWRPDGLAIDSSHPPRAQASRNHNDFTHAVAAISAVKPARAWLTHLSHEFDCWVMSELTEPPAGIEIARDGGSIELRN